MARHPLYTTWYLMRYRTSNPKSPDFHRYGARGICVCPEWQSFNGFISDMGSSYSPGLTLERIDNNAGYSPQNCAWVTRADQANNRRSNRRFEINGVAKTLAEWCKGSTVNPSTIRQRIYGYGWPVERALGMEY